MFQFHHIRTKLLALLSLAAVLTVVLIMGLMIWLQIHLIRGEWQTSLQSQARLIAYNSQAALEFQDVREATRMLKSMQGNPGVMQVHLVADHGQRIFAEYNSPAMSSTWAHDHAYPEGGEGALFEKQRLTVWAPVPGTGGSAAIEVVASLDYLHESIADMVTKTALSLLGMLFVLLFLADRAASRMAAPLIRMSRLTDRVAQDPNLQERVAIHGADELAQLGTSLNQMIDSLQARDRELEQYRLGLEEQVRQRTLELTGAMEAAQAASRAKSDFLARMSHEIRTPMNAIVGLGKLLLKTGLNDNQRNYQEQVLGASDMLLGLINDILDYSRIEAGRLDIEQVDFSLEHVMRDVAGQIALRAQERGLELLFHIDAGVPLHLSGDPLRLRQVLVNLVNNAVKFTEQGEVVLHASVGTGNGGVPELSFAVRDTGMGIAAEKLDELFSPFTQVDGSMTRRFGGSGLGLAICHQLVELMGGRIAVQSTPGVGSTFSFSLPLREASNPVQTSTCQAVSGQVEVLSQLRVLVIDDNASARDILCSMLETFGMRAESAVSGEEGVQRLCQASAAGDPFELVLLDWLMPEMDGIETARTINSTLKDQIPSILMVTAGSFEKLSGLVESVGLRHILTKPVNLSALYDSILEALLARGAIRIEAAPPARAPAAGQPPASYDFSPIAHARILLVDDVALNRTVAAAFLEETGVSIDTAVHGREAVEKVENNDYDLVLMDIQMPEMDGLTATRTLRANPRHASLPILAMTAHAMAGDRENSLAAGMNDHLTKPIDPDALFSALLKWIPHRGVVTDRPVATPAASTGNRDIPELEGVDTAKGLSHCMNRPELYLRLLGNFTGEFGDNAAGIALAQQEGDLERARRLAHSLKSGAATLGAMTLSTQAKAIEYLLADGQQVDDSQLQALDASLQGLCTQLQRLQPVSAAIQNNSAAAASLLGQLKQLLAADDARALGVLEQLEQALAGHAQAGAVLSSVRELIEDVEYEDALAALAPLHSLLESRP